MGATKRFMMENDEFDGVDDPRAVSAASVKAYRGESYEELRRSYRSQSMDRPHRIADAFILSERTLADCLEGAMARLAQSADPNTGPTLTARQIGALIRDGIGPSELEQAARAKIQEREKALKEAEPVTVERLIERAKEIGYTEVYIAFRHRDSTRIDSDRLPDLIDMAPTLEEAMKKLIGIAGYDEEEAKVHGLDSFDVGDFPLLCDKLQELTGDRYDISNYETPKEGE